MKYITATVLLLASGCSVTTNHSSTCDMSEKSHVCPERGHGPCPFCPPVAARYEVRIVNPSTNELLHTTDEFNDAYEYVVEYSSAHADLVIYDLATGNQFEETP